MTYINEKALVSTDWLERNLHSPRIKILDSSWYLPDEGRNARAEFREAHIPGQGRVTKNIEGAPIDDAYRIPDEEALPIVFDLLKHEGLCMGGSTGINVGGAIRLARDMGPGHTIVTVLCDYGQRYQSKLFNPDFLRERNLPAPDWM